MSDPEIELCPSCGQRLDYIEGGQTFYRTLGIQVRGFYDGVAVWACPICGHHWPRNFGSNARRQEMADRLARQANEGLPI